MKASCPKSEDEEAMIGETAVTPAKGGSPELIEFVDSRFRGNDKEMKAKSSPNARTSVGG